MLTFLDVDLTPLKQVLSFFLSDNMTVIALWPGGSCDLLIYDSRLLWQTVSNAVDKSTATQIVRSGSFIWLNPIAISVVICSRAEVVEWSGLKPCWSGAGWRYLLIVGRIRDSSTFAAGQRSEIGRYKVPT